ncbi:unnamed protein product [Musa hybrid cultivar]
MPLSEFYQASARKKFDSAQSNKMASRSSNRSSSMPDNEFVELLWENGPVVMQGKSNRPRKTSIATTNFSLPADRAEGKDSTAIANMPKLGVLEAMDQFVSNFSPSDPSGNAGIISTQFDNMVPWINYPIEEDPASSNYCSEFFSEISGISMPANENNSFGHSTPYVEHGIVSKALEAGSCQSSLPSIMSRIENSPKKDVSSMDLMNSSLFSRPGMKGKANLQSVENSATATASSNRIESTVIQSCSGLQSTSGIQGELNSVSSMLEMGSSAETPREIASVEPLEDVCEQDMPRKNLKSVIEKDHEAIAASSSVGSGNTAGTASGDPAQGAKRKNQGEECGNHKEDLEDASTPSRKPDADAAKGRNAKRSRAAEVHNLSERRRRDRINEKMRALQELIPNCSKVDKASMLDEAIEYLKTLQLQVQMMSMGSGLCMSPVMLPGGMQHLRVPPIAHFAQMGMNMTFGYGMGMLNMNGSPGCSLVAAPPPMPGTQFPCSPLQAPQGLYGMPRPTNLPMFAQGQALPVPVPRVPPPFKSMSGLPANLNSVPEASTTTTSNPSRAPDAETSSSFKDQKASASDSQGTKGSSQQCLSTPSISDDEPAELVNGT